ncbi:MAG: HupE/UreJ family protein, partial [Moraxellaceae bacterium]
VLVFVFGLIHGFGLSTRLQQLPLGNDGLVLKILSFNVGVEIGQVIALSIMLALLSGWRKTQSFQKFSKAANVILLFCGGLLFLSQMHGFQHSYYTDEFPLNRDDHAHAHEDMQGESHLPQYPRRLYLDSPKQNNTPQEHSHDGENFHSR